MSACTGVGDLRGGGRYHVHTLLWLVLEYHPPPSPGPPPPPPSLPVPVDPSGMYVALKWGDESEDFVVTELNGTATSVLPRTRTSEYPVELGDRTAFWEPDGE